MGYRTGAKPASISTAKPTNGNLPLPGATGGEFRLLLISPARTLPGEQALVRELFRAGLRGFHLRKPEMNTKELCSYLEYFTRTERSGIRVHSCDLSLLKTGIAGLHVPYSALHGCSLPGEGITASIHSWKEYASLKNCIKYVFISPVFNSLSKPGYLQNNEAWHLPRVRHVPVIALGGIDSGNIAAIVEAGFSGAALLGSIWQRPESALRTFNEIKNHVANLSYGS